MPKQFVPAATDARRPGLRGLHVLSRIEIRTRLLMVAIVPVLAMASGMVVQQSLGSLAPGPVTAGIALAAATLSVLLAIAVAASITGPLTRLRIAAERGARLPSLVEALRQPGGRDEARSLSPVALMLDDEVGRLGRAFDAFQASAAALAAQQAALLEKGLVDRGSVEVFESVARRIHGLVDRQVELIDGLEAAERDSVRHRELEQVTARVRRVAGSLVALAGTVPTPGAGDPVPTTDVIRAGIAEVDDPGRVDMVVHDEVTVPAGAAAVIVSLLAELLLNATRSSPPDARVMVRGQWGAGGYEISIRDNGIGLVPDALAEANHILSGSPLPAESVPQSLGLVVTGRLARRIGTPVHLASTDNGGITATVLVPPALIVGGGQAEAGPDGALERRRTVLFGLTAQERHPRRVTGQATERWEPPGSAGPPPHRAARMPLIDSAGAAGRPPRPIPPPPVPRPPASAGPTELTPVRPMPPARPVRFSAADQSASAGVVARGTAAGRKPAEEEFERHLERATANGLVRRAPKASQPSDPNRPARPAQSPARPPGTAGGLPEEVRRLIAGHSSPPPPAHRGEPDPRPDAGQEPI